jgi:katanin p60 ATPase-containing subunit A1
MSSTLGDICENVKSARENALLGNYETSQVYYQGALQQIQKLLITITDPVRKQKWQQVLDSVFIYDVQFCSSKLFNQLY